LITEERYVVSLHSLGICIVSAHQKTLKHIRSWKKRSRFCLSTQWKKTVFSQWRESGNTSIQTTKSE